MTDDRVLTTDEIAARLNRAAFRTLRALMDLRQMDGMRNEVVRSRFLHPGTLENLSAELSAWGIEPTATGYWDTTAT
jgi:hypothetical protein